MLYSLLIVVAVCCMTNMFAYMFFPEQNWYFCQAHAYVKPPIYDPKFKVESKYEITFNILVAQTSIPNRSAANHDFGARNPKYLQCLVTRHSDPGPTLNLALANPNLAGKFICCIDLIYMCARSFSCLCVYALLIWMFHPLVIWMFHPLLIWILLPLLIIMYATSALAKYVAPTLAMYVALTLAVYVWLWYLRFCHHWHVHVASTPTLTTCMLHDRTW